MQTWMHDRMEQLLPPKGSKERERLEWLANPDYPSVVRQLQEKMSDYDAGELLATFAALQLIPDNADKLTRLHVLACAAAGIPSGKGSVTATKSILNKLLNKNPAKLLQPLDDPLAGPFTLSLPGPYGPMIVLPGLRPDGPCIFHHLHQALNESTMPRLAPETTQRVRTLVAGACAVHRALNTLEVLSPNIVQVRFPVPPNITIPPQEELQRLKASVIEPDDQWALLFKAAGLPTDCLDPITTRLGHARPPNQEEDACAGSLAAAPIVRLEDRRVFAVPSAILPAAVHAVLREAHRTNELDAVASMIGEGLWRTTEATFYALRQAPLDLEVPPRDGPTWFRDAFFSVDFDKLLYVLLVPDDLHDYNPDKPYRFSNSSPMADLIESRLLEVEAYLKKKCQPSHQFRFLLLSQGFARPIRTEIRVKGLTRLREGIYMPVSLLETISMLDDVDHLFLWRYIEARLQVDADQGIPPMMEEPEIFGHYWNNDRHFPTYLVPEKGMLPVNPADAGILHARMVTRRNPHWMVSWPRNGLAFVVAAHSTPDIPIYAEYSLSGPAPARAVTCTPKPIWVINENSANEGIPNHEPATPDLVDAVSYWLWQFSSYLGAQTGWDHNDQTTFNIHIQADPFPREDETPEEPPDDQTIFQAIHVHSNPEDLTLRIHLEPDAYWLFRGTDNAGERILMSRILDGIGRTLDPEGDAVGAEAAIQTALDNHAPVGHKRRLMMSWTGLMPGMDHRLHAPIALIQPEDRHSVDALIRAHLREKYGLAPGDLPNGEAQRILRNLVSFLFSQLRQRLDNLDPRGLLPLLVALSESLCFYKTSMEVLMPGSNAAFPDERNTVDIALRNEERFYKTYAPLRFLIEYLTAQPPQGTGQYSMLLHGEVIALASRLIDYGFYGDALKADPQVSATVLPNGQIVMQGGDYGELQAEYARSRIKHVVARPQSVAEQLSRKREDVDPSTFSLPLDEIARQTHGARLTDALLLLWSAMNLGMESSGGPMEMEQEAFLKDATQMLEWTDDRAVKALEMVCLDARPTFLDPPPPHTNNDVYPWRFNREFSYFRRPILREGRDGRRILHWGHRHVMLSNQILVHRFTEGRLPEHDQEWKTVLGKHRSNRGDEFEQAVLDLFNGSSRYQARPKVEPWPPDEGLGDVDVLAIDHSSKMLWLLECKCFTLRLTPHEFATERDKLFGSEPTSAAAINRHGRRLKWAQENLEHLIEALKLPSDKGWSVRAGLVFNQPLLSRFVKTSLMPLVSYDELESLIENEQLDRIGR